MSKKYAWRELAVVGVLGISTALVGKAAELFGTNTTPCPPHCTPASPWWGYVQTHWTRWPGAVYPDMTKAPGTNVGNEIPAPSVELPKPSKETDIRTTPPTSNNKSDTGSTTQQMSQESTSEPTPAKPTEAQPLPTLPAPANAKPAPATKPMPDEQPSATLPSTNAKSAPEAKPSEMPPLKEAPGATPPSDNPFFAPPGNTQPLPPTPGSSSALPKSRLHAPNPKVIASDVEFHAVSAPPAANDQPKDNIAARPQETIAAKPLRLRIDVDDFTRPISPDQEPELIVPSLASRPLPSVNLDTSSPRTGTTSIGENRLRSDVGSQGMIPTNLGNVDASRSDTTSTERMHAEAGNIVTSGNSSLNGNVLVNNSIDLTRASATTTTSNNFTGSNYSPNSNAQANPLR
jgi:hypothetical protein